jgi:hypothetical protein
MSLEKKDKDVQKIVTKNVKFMGHINNLEKGILVSGSFKTATSTIQEIFKCVRTHNIYLKNKNVDDGISVVIFPFRNNESVYKSALFQDIIEPVYDYCPFAIGNFLEKYKDVSLDKKKEIIKTVDVDLLIDHYKKINWDKNIHLNNKARLDIINNYYGINIDYSLTDIQDFKLVINNTDFHIICIRSDNIEKNFEELKKIVYGVNRDDIKLKNYNLGKHKWYGEKYIEFINKFK